MNHENAIGRANAPNFRARFPNARGILPAAFHAVRTVERCLRILHLGEGRLGTTAAGATWAKRAQHCGIR